MNSTVGSVATRRGSDALQEIAAWLYTAWRHRDRRLLRLGVLLLAAAALIGCDVFANGALTHLDLRVHDWAIGAHWPDLRPLAATVVLAGQRGPVGVVVGLVVAWTARRLHSWRPLLLPASAVVALNLVVGALKVVIGRSGPYTGRDVFFVGGMEFPSGHASNAVLMWGSLAVVLATSGLVRHRWALVAGVVTVTGVVSGACIVLDTHWLSDLIAGWLVGGALLVILCAILRPAAPLTAPTRHGRHSGRGVDVTWPVRTPSA